jgi:uncharacterized delta-60 repeat protein
MVAFDTNNNIVVTKASFDGSDFNMAVLKYTAQGILDPAFGNINGAGNLFQGMATVDFFGGNDVANALVINSLTNAITIAGFATVPNATTLIPVRQFAIARFLNNGVIDTSFNANKEFSTSQPGTVVTQVSPVSGEATALIQDSSNKLVAAGFAQINGADTMTLVRYNTNGSLDTTFNGTGIVQTSTAVLGSFAQLYGLTLDSAQRLVTVGTLDSELFLIARYNNNGTLDGTFNPGGTVPGILTTSFTDPVTGSTFNAQAFSVIVDDNDNIVIAGVGQTSTTAALIVTRYTPAGILDITFGTAGSTIIPITLENITVSSLTIDAGNNIMVSATSRNISAVNPTVPSTEPFNFTDPFIVVRLNPNGTVDLSFAPHNTTVQTSTVTGGSANTLAVSNSVIIDSLNRVLVTGFLNESTTQNDMILARYNNNGSFDTTFNAAGITPGVVVTNIFFGSSVPSRFIGIDANSKIYVAKSAVVNSIFNTLRRDMALLRYFSDGTPDPSFSILVSLSQLFTTLSSLPIPGLSAFLRAAGVDQSFSLASIINALANTSTEPVVGMVTVSFVGTSVANSMSFDAAQNVYMAGYTLVPQETVAQLILSVEQAVASLSLTQVLNLGDETTSVKQFALTSVLSTGLLNTGFVNFDNAFSALVSEFLPGRVITPIGLTSEANALITDSSNLLVAAGYANFGTIDELVLARYTLSGSLDRTFGTAGISVITTFAQAARAYGLTQDSLQRYIIAGTANFTQILVARYNNNGTLDKTFNSTGSTPGIATTNIAGLSAIAYSVIVDANGKIVVAGIAQTPLIAQLIIVRYNTDGSLDTSFANGGIQAINIPFFNIIVSALAIDDNGRIVVSGESRNTNVTLRSAFNYADPFLLIRLNPNGSIDTSFNAHGFVQPPEVLPPLPETIGVGGDEFTDVSNAVIIDAQKRILVGGFFVETPKRNNVILARYLPTGSFDTSFNPNGTDTGRLVQTGINENSTVLPAGIVLTDTFVDVGILNLQDGGSPTPTAAPSIEEVVTDQATGAEKVIVRSPVPSISYPQNGLLVTENSITIKGQANPSSFVSITIDGQVKTVLPTTAIGDWAYTAALSEGPHSLAVNSLDMNGSITHTSETINFTIASAPLIPPIITSPLSSQEFKQGIITIKGTSKPHASITIFIDQSLTTTEQSNAQGVWSYKTELTEGNHSVYAVVTDGISKMSAPSATIQFSIKPISVKPPTILSPTQKQIIKSVAVNIQGTGTPGNIVILEINNKEIARVKVNDQSEWTHTAYLTNGTYEMQAKQISSDNITSKSSAVISFTVDKRVPTRKKIFKNMPTVITRPIEFSGKAPVGSVVTISINNQVKQKSTIDTAGRWSFMLDPKDFKAQNYTIHVMVSDKKNNRTWLSSKTFSIEKTENPQ